MAPPAEPTPEEPWYLLLKFKQVEGIQGRPPLVLKMEESDDFDIGDCFLQVSESNGTDRYFNLDDIHEMTVSDDAL